MTGLRTRAVHAIGRSSVGVLSVTAALLFVAAPAGATPESDADAAITANWHGDGGAGGELGDKDGDVYQVGDGFGQNFAAGKIYFTPRTGAHYVLGAVLDKYQSLGGPADSDLGFPTADEGAGKVDGSRDSTFSAADKPVIFWTPDNGAWVVRGAVNAAWDKLGGSAGVLGVPTADETWKGTVVSQAFTGGTVNWDAKAKTFTTSPAELAGQLTGITVPGDATTAIDAARRAAGGPLGPLGAEEGAQYKVGDKGVGQNYAGGAIFYSPDTGANVVTGALLAKYRAAGGPQGDLGLPATGETDGAAPASRIVTFTAADQPVIFSTPDHGTYIVRGAMNAAWNKLGGAAGQLGVPTADQRVNGDVVSQQFSAGSISWNSATRAFTVDPASLTAQLAGLQIPGQDMAKAQSASHSGKWYQFHWWWLLAIIPLVLAVGALAIAALLRRRRRAERIRADNAPLEHDDHPADDGHEYAADHYTDEHYGDEHYAGEHFDDEHYAAGHFDGEHYADEHIGDDHAAEHFGHDEGSDHGGPQPFQENPDAVDTAPNAVVNPDDHSAPATEAVPAPGWAGLGARWGAAGLGAAGHQESEPEAEVAEPAEDDDHTHGTGLGAAAVGVAGLGAGAGLAAARVFGHHHDADEDVEAETHDAEHRDDAEHPADAEPAAGPATGRHHAADLDEPETAQMSFRVAIGDNAPDGYTIKANTKSGEYWVPGTPGYDKAPTEIWFASEEFAITNGFIRG